MRSAKMWLCAAIVTAALAGAALVTGTAPSRASTGAQEPRAAWHYHDGRWNFWDEEDRNWYYTDGAHWFYRHRDAWRLYRFDKNFGREGFKLGEYKLPRDEERIAVPRHNPR